MSINLSKGVPIDLSKEAASLRVARICTGWDINKYNTGAKFDLDESAFCLNENGKCTSERDMISYAKLEDGTSLATHPSGAIKYLGDNQTGEGDGDDEVITVDLTQVPDYIQKIVFVVTIFDAETRNQNFGQIENAYIRIVDDETGEEIAKADLTEDFSFETAVTMGELYRHNGAWRFKAIEAGYNNGLAGYVRDFGLSTT